MRIYKLRIFGDLLYLIAIIVLVCLSLYPCLYLFKFRYDDFQLQGANLFEIALILSFCYLLFGLVMLFLTVMVKQIFRINPTSHSHSIYAKKNSISFSIYHSLINICNHFYLGLFRSTILLNIYFRLMGARIGKRTIINTTRISDCNNVIIGRECLIGGDVVINGHSAEGDTLYKGKVVIGNNVTIGQYTTVLPGVTIEDNVIIGANSLVPKNSILESNHIYGGVPVRKLKMISNSNTFLSTDIPRKEKEEEQDIDENKKHDILIKSYELRHSEILKIEGFMQNVMVTTLGLIFSTITYAILENRPKMLLLLPVLAGLSYAIVINLTTTMLKNAYYMISIELFYKKNNLLKFDWEINEGIFGKSRSLSLDNVLINLIYLLTYICGLILTYKDIIVKPQESLFLNKPLKYPMLALDGFLFLWIVFSLSFYLLKRRSLKKKLGIALD